jgi:hypothetical protein
MIITESDMVFGEYAEDDVCYIEKSSLYHSIKASVKSVEFILSRPNKHGRSLVWLEAKTSFPSPGQDSFINDISKISDKFIHSLELFAAAMMNKIPNADKDLEKFCRFLGKVPYQFILVIKRHKKEWLHQVEIALKQKLSAQIYIWKLDINKDIVVMNEDMAIEYKLAMKREESR